MPTPAAAGLNEEPETPVPLKAPPAGLSVSGTAPSFTQYVAFKPVTDGTGGVCTVTVAVAVLVQPFASVPVTV